MFETLPAVHGAMGCGQRKRLKLVWRCQQLLSRLLAKGQLPRVSRLSDNDKDDNKMIPGAVHRSPSIWLRTEEYSGKPQLRDRVMKAVRSVIASNVVHFLQMRSVQSHSTSGSLQDFTNRDKVIVDVC